MKLPDNEYSVVQRDCTNTCTGPCWRTPKATAQPSALTFTPPTASLSTLISSQTSHIGSERDVDSFEVVALRNEEELVVLVDEVGVPLGTAPKSTVHSRDTPLHLAFSCYLFDDKGRLLITRRAIDKPTWPGVWSNSCCGHPWPGESPADAVRRRVKEELGFDVIDLRAVLPCFRYRAQAADGTVENELCPVFAARVLGVGPEPAVDPCEVMAWEWVPWETYMAVAEAASWAISPWSSEQLAEWPNASSSTIKR